MRREWNANRQGDARYPHVPQGMGKQPRLCLFIALHFALNSLDYVLPAGQQQYLAPDQSRQQGVYQQQNASAYPAPVYYPTANASADPYAPPPAMPPAGVLLFVCLLFVC